MEETKTVEKKVAEAPERAERTRQRRVYAPDVDIVEKKDHIVLVADMPGVDENSVDITLEKDVLTIHGKLEPEIPEGMKLALTEYGIGDYERSFTLSNEIDLDGIKASVKNGVLRLMLPKATVVKTKKIEVRAE